MPTDIPPEELCDRLSAWQWVGGQRIEEPRPGSDMEQEVALTLRQAYRGVTCRYGKKHPVELKIPSGVDTGTRVRFAGQGTPGHRGGRPGDLYLLIQVRPCPGFERRGDDLYHQCEANLAELALGVELPIRTVEEKLLGLTIPPGTLPGQRFRLAGQGMPRLFQPDQHGDLYVTVNAKIPPRLEKIRRSQAPHDPTCREDDIFALLFLVVVFVAGIGAGLLLWWLILE
jgi:curved DNA-binding protein